MVLSVHSKSLRAVVVVEKHRPPHLRRCCGRAISSVAFSDLYCGLLGSSVDGADTIHFDTKIRRMVAAAGLSGCHGRQHLGLRSIQLSMKQRN